MGKGLVILGVLGIISFLPICRGAGHSRHDGVSLWKLLRDSTHLTPDSPFGHPHILYEEAVHRARTAYQTL